MQTMATLTINRIGSFILPKQPTPQFVPLLTLAESDPRPHAAIGDDSHHASLVRRIESLSDLPLGSVTKGCRYVASKPPRGGT
jgi:hypothetical protein